MNLWAGAHFPGGSPRLLAAWEGSAGPRGAPPRHRAAHVAWSPCCPRHCSHRLPCPALPAWSAAHLLMALPSSHSALDVVPSHDLLRCCLRIHKLVQEYVRQDAFGLQVASAHVIEKCRRRADGRPPESGDSNITFKALVPSVHLPSLCLPPLDGLYAP